MAILNCIKCTALLFPASMFPVNHTNKCRDDEESKLVILILDHGFVKQHILDTFLRMLLVYKKVLYSFVYIQENFHPRNQSNKV